MNSMELKYGCNPNQKPARVFMKDGQDLPFTVLNGRPGYINLLDAFNSWQLVRELREATGLPAAIENDIWGTDYAIGTDTAVNTILQAINEIRDTAKAHRRTFIIEVMGNKCGWLATYSAVAGGGNMVIVPEEEFDKEKIINKVQKLHDGGKSYLVILASEGTGNMQELVKELEARTGISTRLTVLGLVQRGGSPTANDRVFASVLGEQATLAAVSGLHNIVFGMQRGNIVCIDLRDAITNKKEYPEDLRHLAEVISL